MLDNSSLLSDSNGERQGESEDISVPVSDLTPRDLKQNGGIVNKLSGRFLDVEELCDILQGNSRSSSSILNGVKQNTYFVIRNVEKRKQGKRSNFDNDCRAWLSKSSSTKKTLFYCVDQTFKMVQLKNGKYGTKQLREWMPLEPQPLEEEVMIMRRLFVLET